MPVQRYTDETSVKPYKSKPGDIAYLRASNINGCFYMKFTP